MGGGDILKKVKGPRNIFSKNLFAKMLPPAINNEHSIIKGHKRDRSKGTNGA